MNYPIDFDAPPAIGTVIPYFRNRLLTLIELRPYDRKDGTPSFILVWEARCGCRCSSGMRSKAVQWSEEPNPEMDGRLPAKGGGGRVKSHGCWGC